MKWLNTLRAKLGEAANWIREHTPTWSHFLWLSRIMWGGIMILVDHATDVQALLTAYGAPAHTIAFVGLALIAAARINDAVTGRNPF